MQILCDHLRGPWVEGLICFGSLVDTASKLIQMPPGTFVVRLVDDESGKFSCPVVLRFSHIYIGSQIHITLLFITNN